MVGNDSGAVLLEATALENSIDFKLLHWIRGDTKGLSSLFYANTRLWMSVILLGTDLLSLSFAVFSASQISHMAALIRDRSNDGIFLVLAVMLIVLYARKGLYPAMGMHYVDELRHTVTSSTVAFAAMIYVTVVFQPNFLAPSLVLLVAGLLNPVIVPFGRYFIRRFMIWVKMWGEPVAIIGDSEKARHLAEYFTTNMQFGLRPAAVLHDELTEPGGQWPCPSLPVCRIKVFARNLSLKTALIIIDDLNDIDALVERYRFVFQRVILIKEQHGSYGLAGLRSLDFVDLLGLQVKNDLLSASSQLSKRFTDAVISFFGILFLSPLIGIIAALIRLDSRGAVFYRQPRLGRNGQVFNVLKFRTMYQDADRIFAESLARDPDLKKEWDAYQKLRNDPRLTRVGKFLRKFSLDELPQFFNVWRGEMSLVGPRPIMLDQRKLYGESFTLYIRVAPGMTGLWQISGRNATTFARRAELDMEYIQRWSQWLDIYIFFKTIKIVLWRNGAY